MSHKADGGGEIGWSGAADVNLHGGPQRGNERATRSGALLDDPIGRIPRLNPQSGRQYRFTRGSLAPPKGARMMPATTIPG